MEEKNSDIIHFRLNYNQKLGLFEYLMQYFRATPMN